MASNKLVTLIAAVLILLPAIAMAKDIVVGDDSGWKLNFDYQVWAKDKVFQVGDTLVFKYKPPTHNVYKVDGAGFKDCTKPAANEALTSGNDKVELKTAGKKWYICGVSDHCDQGMKLTLNVTEKSSAARGIIFPRSQVFGVAIFAIVAIVM
ncbi:putative cupredoxin [Rosa chinensis]|uniref:Putative cupredoxin n=1 Tax=Rosa chinensis TaxID=74649 RepID=A0A2P6R3W1_ROSCH|nr:blue copper protein 1a [Rosa chinensis]PRQ41123.1 putative cupredoxin [Rosa chinensis]